MLLDLCDNPQLRIVIVTGTGEKFLSVSWDLKAATGDEVPDVDFGPGGFAGPTEIFSLGKPVIAVVSGCAFGDGPELALMADFIVYADNTNFALPEAKLGVIPDNDGVLRLLKIPSPAIISEMVTTGRRTGIKKTPRQGVVDRVASQVELMNDVRGLAQQLVSSVPLATVAPKEIYRITGEIPVEEAYHYIRSDVLKHYPSVLHSEDTIRGSLAFTEERDPTWKGH